MIQTAGLRSSLADHPACGLQYREDEQNRLDKLMSTSDSTVPPGTDLAYFFSDWIWREGSTNLMKSMLLFFDGLTLALPPDLAAEIVESDPVLAAPLAEHGLLINFDPLNTLDTESAERLVVTLTQLLEKDPWLWERGGEGYLGSFHWGAARASSPVVEAFEHELSERGLITPILREGVYRMAGNIRLLVFLLFAQTLRTQLGSRGVNLHPATDDSQLLADVTKALDIYLPTIFISDGKLRPGDRDSIIYWETDDLMDPRQLADDLRNVGADLSAVPLDEVLDFRAKNGQHYRAYARALRDFLVTVKQANPTERQRVREERTLEIEDYAADLRRISRAAFGIRTATLLVSLAGAAWTLGRGDPIGALLAGSAASIQALPARDRDVTAYSYLVRARDLGRG